MVVSKRPNYQLEHIVTCTCRPVQCLFRTAQPATPAVQRGSHSFSMLRSKASTHQSLVSARQTQVRSTSVPRITIQTRGPAVKVAAAAGTASTVDTFAALPACLQAVTGMLSNVFKFRTAGQHQHARQQHNSRVLLCTAVLRSNSSTNSSSMMQQLQQHSRISRRSSSLQPLPHSKRFSSIQRHVMPPLAMVNVDFASPSLVLGVTLIGCGVALLQVRETRLQAQQLHILTGGWL